ncbi:MAG: hypothetical protein JW874_03885 [Spirochaetales bacterium]|nr:hypothetical protein [Spirochaetales bacterium]
MKKALFFAVLITLCADALLQAQENDRDKLYAKTKMISKIYIHKDGYKILYQKSDMNFATFYIPMSWFGGADSKAEIFMENDRSYPYFSVFYRNGEFDHIRIYAKKDLNDETWGSLDTRYDFSKQFAVEKFEIEY